MPESPPLKTTVVLGFDFGMKRIGIAIGTLPHETTNGVTTLNAVDGIPNWQEIDDIIKEWQPSKLVCGIPLNMDGSTQHLTFAARKFANRLEHRSKLPVCRVDERLTTRGAKERIQERSGKQWQKRKKLDQVAAELILEDFFSSSQNN